MGDQATAAEGAANETTGTGANAAAAGAGDTSAEGAGEGGAATDAAPAGDEPTMEVELTVSITGAVCKIKGEKLTLPQSEAIRACEAGIAIPVADKASPERAVKKGAAETR